MEVHRFHSQNIEDDDESINDGAGEFTGLEKSTKNIKLIK